VANAFPDCGSDLNTDEQSDCVADRTTKRFAF
jgi:hypothetical protein